MTATLVAHVLAFDTAFLHLADVEGLVRDLVVDAGLPADVTVCTHIVRDPSSRYAVTVAFASTPDAEVVDRLRARLGTVDCAEARAQVERADGGRAVVFPGQHALRGSLPVASAVAWSALDRVELLGGVPAADDDVLETRDFVRPVYRGGELVLPVTPARPGKVAPFEIADPPPCCGGLL